MLQPVAVRVVPWALVLPLAGTLACGTDDDVKLTIIGNVRPDESCHYSTNVSPDCVEDREIYCEGYVDIAFNRPYIAHLLVENSGADPVEIVDGYRNVWYEPAHRVMITGQGSAARNNLLVRSVDIPGNGKRIVEVDVLGDAFIVYKREFERLVAAGGLPEEAEECTVQIVLEGDADGVVVESNPWTYGMNVDIGTLVDFVPGADSPTVAGPDCCVQVADTERCEPGQNYNYGSCTECNSCWPEICNGGVPPYGSPQGCNPELPRCQP